MRTLIARFSSAEELLERYERSFRFGGLFLPTRKAIEPGEAVVLDIRMAPLRDHMLIRGVVIWRQRGKRSTGQRAGLGIEFLASEQSKRDYLLALAKGNVGPQAAQRRHRRLPVEMRVDWRVPAHTDRHASLLEDIGPGGAFIRTLELPKAGTSIVLEVSPPGANVAQTIEGRVAWTRATPGTEGVGVEFRARDIGGMRRLRELCRRIEQRPS